MAFQKHLLVVPPQDNDPLRTALLEGGRKVQGFAAFRSTVDIIPQKNQAVRAVVDCLQVPRLVKALVQLPVVGQVLPAFQPDMDAAAPFLQLPKGIQIVLPPAKKQLQEFRPVSPAQIPLPVFLPEAILRVEKKDTALPFPAEPVEDHGNGRDDDHPAGLLRLKDRQKVVLRIKGVGKMIGCPLFLLILPPEPVLPRRQYPGVGHGGDLHRLLPPLGQIAFARPGVSSNDHLQALLFPAATFSQPTPPAAKRGSPTRDTKATPTPGPQAMAAKRH